MARECNARNEWNYLQVREFVGSLERGRLDTRNPVAPEIQVLQLRELVEKPFRLDFLDRVVSQQPAVK